MRHNTGTHSRSATRRPYQDPSTCPHSWQRTTGLCHRPGRGHQWYEYCHRCLSDHEGYGRSRFCDACRLDSPPDGGFFSIVAEPRDDHSWRPAFGPHVLGMGHAVQDACSVCDATRDGGFGRAPDCAACYPGAPVVTEPADGVELPLHAIWIRWRPVPGRVVYRIAVDDRTLEQPVIPEVTVDREEFQIPSDRLVPGHLYRVRLRAVSDMPDAPGGAEIAERRIPIMPLAILDASATSFSENGNACVTIAWRTTCPADR